MYIKTFIIVFFSACSSYFIYLQTNVLLSHSTKTMTTTKNPELNSRQEIPPIPKPQALNENIVLLGKQLFFDSLLSKNNTVSCASCHSLHNGGVDGLSLSFGNDFQQGNINAPTVLNSSLNFKQFWDGRANTLEQQIDGPINNAIEMASSWPEVIEKLQLNRNYQKKFKQLFPDVGVSEQSVKKAIATFERSLLTPDSRFDLFLKGDKKALNQTEKKGYQLFVDYGCISCHQGANMGGNMYGKMGIMNDYFADRKNITKADLGRYNLTHKDEHRYEFKVPSLRNIALTAPYFHDGQTKDLNSAVQKMAYYQLGIEIKDPEIESIVSFLKTLTGKLAK